MNIHVSNPSWLWTDPGCLSPYFSVCLFYIFCLIQTKTGWGLCQNSSVVIRFWFSRKMGTICISSGTKYQNYFSSFFWNGCNIQVGNPRGEVGGVPGRSQYRPIGFRDVFHQQHRKCCRCKQAVYIVCLWYYSHIVCMCRYWSLVVFYLSLSFRSFVTAGSLILTDRWWHCRKEEGFSIICWRGHTLGTLSRQQ